MTRLLILTVLYVGLLMPSVAQRPAELTDALEGLDPVALVAGREVPGRQAFTAAYEGFQYLFESAANKAVFEKSPETYAVQVRGMCARMGAPVAGNHGLYAVHEGRIYIFASEGCKTAFQAAPIKYIARPQVPTPADATATAAARRLLDRAAEGLGGAAKVDAVVGLRTVTIRTQRGRDGAPRQMTLTTTIVWPNRLRQDMAMGTMTNSVVVADGEGFGSTAAELRSLQPAQAESLSNDLLRSPLWLIRGRRDPALRVWPEGQSQIGDVTTDDVGLFVRGERVRLSIDRSTGRVLQLTYTGRGPTGEVGTVTTTLEDFRDVGGLVLPHRESRPASGTPATAPTVYDRIEVNPAVDASFFVRPVR